MALPENIVLSEEAQHRDLIAHPCVQNILSDLMMGGLDLRRHSNIKVPLRFDKQFYREEFVHEN